MPSLYSRFKPIAFKLAPDTENRLLNMVAKDIVTDLPEDILTAYPKFQTPGMQEPSPTQKLATYTQNTVPEDFPLIRNPDYLKQYNKGLMPPPVSPLWNKALGMQPVFELMQKDFNKTYDQLVGSPT